MRFKYIMNWAGPCRHPGEENLISCGEATPTRAECRNVVTYTCVSHAVCGRCGEGDRSVLGRETHEGAIENDWPREKTKFAHGFFNIVYLERRAVTSVPTDIRWHTSDKRIPIH